MVNPSSDDTMTLSPSGVSTISAAPSTRSKSRGVQSSPGRVTTIAATTTMASATSASVARCQLMSQPTPWHQHMAPTPSTRRATGYDRGRAVATLPGSGRLRARAGSRGTGGLVDDDHRLLVHLRQKALAQHLSRRAAGDDLALVHEDETVGVDGGGVEVVENDHDRALPS